MADLKLYDVDGRTLLLSDEDAKLRGLSGGKARGATYEVPELNKDTGAASSDDAESKPVTTGKARTASNK